MNIRNPISLSLVLALLAPLSQVATAAPLVSIGDNADLFFNGSSGLRWSSNIFRDEADDIDDFWWTLTPGFELNLGRGVSNADLTIVTRYEIRRYADLNDLDTELFSIQANGSYRSSRLDLSGSAYFREEKTASGDINFNQLVESDTMGGNINAEYRFSPKFSIGAGFRYSDKEYQAPFDGFFADRETSSVPLDIFYELTPKVDLSIGYTYSETDVDSISPNPFAPFGRPAYSTEDHFFNVGARGNLLPKLTGFFKVGYRMRDNDRPGSSSNSTLGLDADLTWAATPKLTNRLALSRDFGVAGEGFSSEDTSVSLTSNYSLNSYFAATAFADYTLREYTDINREDNQYRLGGRLTYTPNQYWQFGAGYTYSENDSNAFNRSYVDHSVDITASLRY